VNSFEYWTTETEQVQLEQTEQVELAQKESQTILRPTMPAPQTNLEEEESPAAGEEKIEIVELEPFLPVISSELSYSCLLIPRFSDHYLTGDITNDLVEWMKEICISYGWRLDAILIRPGYLHWVITVPLTANPAQFMRLTRQQTSKKILEDYPRFTRKNVSLDFWAPGFSVVHGNNLQPMEAINSYILQIRRQQGII